MSKKEVFKPKLGRPFGLDENRTLPRTFRLNDERWEKLKVLGRPWLEKVIDRAKLKP